MPDVTASLVVYRTPPAELVDLFTALQSANLVAWVVVDNAAAEFPEQAAELSSLVKNFGGDCLAAPKNLGFGGGHNAGLSYLLHKPSDFHLLVNPDIVFEPSAIQHLEQVMLNRPEVALTMPRVVYPDGSTQFLCRLLPTPLDFALRRFSPRWLQNLFRTRLNQYELRGLEDTPCDKVPFLSGCFMFTRRSALESTGGFDERFFLYLEDVDLCRRLITFGTLLYWPAVTVIHGCYRGAYRNRKLMLIFMQSAVRYFNHWGWFFDSARRRANAAALACIPPTE